MVLRKGKNMKAHVSEWKEWYGDTLEINVDAEMLGDIIHNLEKEIENKVIDKDYAEVTILIKGYITLKEKIDKYYAERETNENS